MITLFLRNRRCLNIYVAPNVQSGSHRQSATSGRRHALNHIDTLQQHPPFPSPTPHPLRQARVGEPISTHSPSGLAQAGYGAVQGASSMSVSTSTQKPQRNEASRVALNRNLCVRTHTQMNGSSNIIVPAWADGIPEHSFSVSASTVLWSDLQVCTCCSGIWEMLMRRLDLTVHSL